MTSVNNLNECFIGGFVPVSLIDFPGKIASVIFTHGCNLRCRYCHNPELVYGRKTHNYLGDLFFHLQGKDIEGVAVSGGEPLVSCGIMGLLEQIKSLGYAVKLDTNGTNPRKLREVCERGLVDFVSVDVKAFNDDDIKGITRTDHTLDRFYDTVAVMKGLDVPFELRHTLWKVPDSSDVDILMAKTDTDKLSVQFPVNKGKWLDKRFSVNFSAKDVAEIKRVFERYDVVYRNYSE